MKVFSDMHHAGLYNSLRLLFEERLGWELYRPCGMEWADEGYWLVHAPYEYSQDTARQYLDVKTDYKPIDGTVPLNTVITRSPTHYEVQDLAYQSIQKAITLEQFASMQFDYIIASIPAHYTSFTKLRDRYQPKAKVICQMGNMFNEIHNLMRNGTVRNLLASTISFDVPSSVNAVFYHQEFDTNVFSYRETYETNTIRSFVNLLPRPETFHVLQELLPEYRLESYGSGCPHGIIHVQDDLALKMQDTMFGYHDKPYCDGYGHIIHNWFAVGRPVIVNLHEYKNYMAGQLMIEDDNCIALDGVEPLSVVADKIKAYSEPQKYASMCASAYQSFKSTVDFWQEQEYIEAFLSRCH